MFVQLVLGKATKDFYAAGLVVLYLRVGLLVDAEVVVVSQAEKIVGGSSGLEGLELRRDG